MTYIFLDESGDLGFSERSSRWFILTMLFTNHHRKVEKCVKKIHSNLRKKYKKVSELHAYHANEATRKRLLNYLAQVDDLKILTIILNKDKVYTDLKQQKALLYNYTANILLDRLHNKNILIPNKKISLCIDQRETNTFLKQNLENYLHKSLSKKSTNNFEIQLKASHTDKCLQATDFVSWAIFRKYEQDDVSYYNIIKNKVIEENQLFP